MSLILRYSDFFVMEYDPGINNFLKPTSPPQVCLCVAEVENPCSPPECLHLSTADI